MATYDNTTNDPTRNKPVPVSEFETDKEKREKAERVKEAAGEMGHEMKEKAAGIAERKLEEGKEMGAQNLEQASQAFRDTAETLREDNFESLARGTEWTAERIDMATRYFRDRSVEDIMHDMRHLARENPMMVLGGALMAGFLTARFLGSSSKERHGTSAPPARYQGSSYRARYYEPAASRPRNVVETY